MKILMEKPTPSISTQTDNTTSNNPDLFEMLSACLFTDVMNAADHDEKPAATDNHEEIDNNAVANPALTSTLDSMQKMIEEMLLQASSYQTQQPATKPDVQVNTVNTRANLVQEEVSKEQPTINQDVAQNNVTPNKTIAITLPVNADSQHEPDQHDLEEKLTAIQKKLTPSVKTTNETEINQTMNNLATQNIRVEDNNSKTQSIQIESQTKTLKKTLESWTQSISARNESAPVVTPATQATRDFSEMLSTRQSTNMAEKSNTTPLAMELEHIEPSTSQPGMFHVKIKVNPPELGPIHASIKMNNNKVEIQIMTSNNHTEQVVKAHLSALTSQFNESSMQLNTVVVQQQSLSNAGQEQSSQQSPEQAHQEILPPTINPTQTDDKKETKSNMLVDAYI